MRKIGFIFTILILFSGCSVLRNRSVRYSENSGKTTQGNVFQEVEKNNITNSNFYIEKAEFEVITSEAKQKFLGSIKFQKPDKYLISFKNFTGIEAARILVSGDTILANDRINRKFYKGSSNFILRKYGIPEFLFAMVFGDFVGKKSAEKELKDCLDGKISTECAIKGIRISYTIDCKKNKVISAVSDNSLNRENFRINYSGFNRKNELVYPGMIEINDIEKSIFIKIKILKISSPWEGEIEFIPGNRYELIELL